MAAPRESVWARLDGRFGRHVGLALLLHAVVMATAASIPAEAASLRLDGHASKARWVEYVLLPEQAPPEKPHPAEQAEKREASGDGGADVPTPKAEYATC